ncbi:MAG TPA: hypothetical protein PK006_05865 [Saprospiraceae bacterium]|nr:hypothetical protein [Saprospiraceae bacterium]
MKSILISIILLVSKLDTYSQKRWIIWSHHEQNIDLINGVSLGIGSYISKKSDVNGIKLDIPGIGIFVPMGLGEDPFRPPDIISDSIIIKKHLDRIEIMKLDGLNKTNGIFISLTGDKEDLVNGIVINPVGGSVEISNGINLTGIIGLVTLGNGLSLSAFMLSAGTINGLSIASLFNSAVMLNGLQIGLYNRSSKTKGFQIGLWNKNEKRSLPIFNWNWN